MEKTNAWIERFKNPALWFAAVSFFFWVSIKLYMVDVIDDRLDKKIALQNQMHIEFDEFETYIIERVHKVEMSVKNEEIKRLEAEVEFYKNK